MMAGKSFKKTDGFELVGCIKGFLNNISTEKIMILYEFERFVPQVTVSNFASSYKFQHNRVHIRFITPNW